MEQIGKSSLELHEMKGFYGQKGRREELAKSGSFSDKITSLWGANCRGLWGIYIPSADQGIPDCLVKIIFLWEAETAIRLGIKSPFGMVGLAQVTPFGPVVFFWTVPPFDQTLKVIQSCLTVCDPIDCSPPGSYVHGILQARYWSWWPFPSPGLSRPGRSSPGLLHCRQILYCLSHQGSPFVTEKCGKNLRC